MRLALLWTLVMRLSTARCNLALAKQGAKQISRMLSIGHICSFCYLIAQNSVLLLPLTYNYFTGVLLSELVFKDQISSFMMMYDERNKETHPNKRFEEYLQTKLYGTAFESDTNIAFTLRRGKLTLSPKTRPVALRVFL